MAGKVVKQLAGSGSGQSLMDRVTAAKHSLAGSGLAKAVCKATTEEIAPPKKKHLQYLIECTNESNVSIPELALEILERLKHPNWVVVFKSLVSMHNLMNHGSEKFTQYLASNNCHIALPEFADKTSVQAMDMSRFICRYSCYIQEKADTYRMMAFDFCKIKRGCDDAVMRTMPVEKIFAAVGVLLKQFDALLEFEATASDLTNGVINAACIILYRDATRLFVVFNDCIINLLTKFFKTMNKKQCKEALEIYKKFLVRSDRLNEFSKIAEFVGVDKSDITHLDKHPISFLHAMEAHLAQLEGREYVPPPEPEEEPEVKKQPQQHQPPPRPSSISPGASAAAAASAPPPPRPAGGPPRPPAPAGGGSAPPPKPEPPRMAARTPERPAPPVVPPAPAAATAAAADNDDYDGGHEQQQHLEARQQEQQQQQPAAEAPAAAANSGDILAAFMANQVTAIASAQSSDFDPFDSLLQTAASQHSAGDTGLATLASNMSVQSKPDASASASGNKSSGVNWNKSAANQANSDDPFGNL